MIRTISASGREYGEIIASIENALKTELRGKNSVVRRKQRAEQFKTDLTELKAEPFNKVLSKEFLSGLLSDSISDRKTKSKRVLKLLKDSDTTTTARIKSFKRARAQHFAQDTATYNGLKTLNFLIDGKTARAGQNDLNARARGLFESARITDAFNTLF